MGISEPEGWVFTDNKLHVSNIDYSSSEDSSDDEPLFSRTKSIKTKKFKKIVRREELLPE